MPTAKQIEASRANGSRSKGPKSGAGKAISALNALKFGFHSRAPVLPGEDAAEWREFSDHLRAALDPVGERETMLASSIIQIAWRQRRVAVIDAAIFTTLLRQEEESVATDAAEREIYEASEHPNLSMGRAFIRDCSESNAFQRLSRYENGMNLSLHRDLKELTALQEERKNKKLQNEPEKEVFPIQSAA